MSSATIAIITLGCAKNEVDSSMMARRLEQAGFSIVDDPEAADVSIVNTCSFIQPAIEESLDAIFELAGLPPYQESRSSLIVSGCLPSRFGADLEGELDEAAALVPVADEERIVEVVRSVLGKSGRDLDAPASSLTPASLDSRACSEASGADDPAPSPHSAYVKISDGCDRFCSYCTIPFIRGRYHSHPLDAIVDEVRFQVSQGVREVVLIAQDSGRWGRDLTPASSLTQLLAHLTSQFPDTWFRIMYTQPEGVTDELLDLMASTPNFCSYLDIPLQHCDPEILHAMNRTGSADSFLALLDKIRAKVPEAALRTTLIAGFPGETQAQHEALLEFIEQAAFDYVGVFPYSQEEGTKAATLPGQLDEQTKQERAQELRDLADEVSSGVIASRVGSVAEVLVLGFEEDGQAIGRSQFQAPEVDGVTFIDEGSPGEIARYEIVGSLLYEMEGERV